MHISLLYIGTAIYHLQVSYQVLCSYDLAHQHFIPVDVLFLFTRGLTDKLITYMFEGGSMNN